MITAIIVSIFFLILAAALGLVPYVTALPFDLTISLSLMAGYWYNFTHLVWFLTPVWNVFTWYFLIFKPLMMLAKLIFGNRIHS